MLNHVCNRRFREMIRSVIILVDLMKLNVLLLHLLTHVLTAQFKVTYPTAISRRYRQRHRARVVDADIHYDALVRHTQSFFNDAAKRCCFQTLLACFSVLRFCRAQCNGALKT